MHGHVHAHKHTQTLTRFMIKKKFFGGLKCCRLRHLSQCLTEWDQRTDVVVRSKASLPVVLVDNGLYDGDGLVDVLRFVYVHSPQHHLVLVIAVTER